MRGRRVESGSPGFIPRITGNEYLCFCGNSMSVPAGIDQRKSAGRRGRKPLAYVRGFRHCKRLGTKRITLADSTHGNLFELRFLLGERDEENVAADVGAHHFHDLRLGHVLHAGDFNVVARLDAETPRAFAVVINSDRRRVRRHREHTGGDAGPEQAIGSFLRKRAATGGDALLPAKKRRFLVYIQVNQARVVQFLARASGREFQRWAGTTPPARWWARFPRHQFRSVVARNR